jgi:hypothetical protein
MDCGFPTGDAFNETRLKELEEHIKKFKRLVFGPYQVSGMGTNKFHLLDHAPEDCRRLGGFLLMSSDTFDFSKTKGSWLREAIGSIADAEDANRQLGALLDGSLCDAEIEGNDKAEGSTRKKLAIVADSASLSMRGARLSLESIPDENFRQGAPQRGFAIAGGVPRESPSNSAAGMSPEKKLVRELGWEATLLFLDELNARQCAAGGVDDGERGSLMYPANELPAALLGKHVVRVASGYAVSVGVRASSCVNVLPHGRGRGTEGETAAVPSGSGNGRLVITMREQMRRSVHRIVASGRYYANPRCDNVLVALSGEHESQLAAGARVSGRSRAIHIIHCVKALAFFRVPFLSEGGHVSLQYYDVWRIESTQPGTTGCTIAPNDACETHIGCVRLRLARNAHSQPFFDLLPVSS